jgi:hypothetical protein
MFVNAGLLYDPCAMQTAAANFPQPTNRANNSISDSCISATQADDRKKAMRALVLEHLEDAGRWGDPHMRIEPEVPGDTAFFWNRHPLSTLRDRQILRPASVTKLHLIQ